MLPNYFRRARYGCAYKVIGTVFATTQVALAGDWAQWGGPNRDFKSAETGLVADWPADGPSVLWKRELGEGYSAILASNGTLYTMYRAGEEEHAIALDAATGKPKWDFAYPAQMPPKADTNFGKGPNSTPLLVGDRLITVGFGGMLHCLEAATGKVVWTHDLPAEFQATFLAFGYSSSPLLHKDMVILPIGAKGRSLMAFSVADGKERWSSADFENSYSSPILVDVGGKKHVVLVMTKEIVGFDADTGAHAWSHEYKNQWDTHCTTAVDCGGGNIFFPTFEGGALLEVKPAGTKYDVKEVWKSNKMGVGQANVIRVGDYLYGSSGSGRASFFGAVNLKDGKVAWRERMPLANAVFADGRLFALNETGELAMIKPTPEKMEVVSKAALLEAKAWTAPTLANGVLYLRDQKTAMALKLSN